MNIEHVYEIVDSSNDEMYFPLGIFLTQSSAIKAIKEYVDKKEMISENAEEYEIIKVYKRKIGFSWDQGECVYTIEREYDHENNCWIEVQ